MSTEETIKEALKSYRPRKRMTSDERKDLEARFQVYLQEKQQKTNSSKKPKRRRKEPQKTTKITPPQPKKRIVKPTQEQSMQSDFENLIQDVCYICFGPATTQSQPPVQILDELFQTLQHYNITLHLASHISKVFCINCWTNVRTAIDTLLLVEKAAKFWPHYLVKVTPIIEERAKMMKEAEVESDHWNDDDDDWAFGTPLIETEEKPKRNRGESMIEKWAPHMRERDVVAIDQNTGRSSLVIDIPADDDGRSELYEYDFLCRSCLIGFKTTENVLEHSRLVHNLTEKRSIHARIIAHRSIKDTNQLYCPKCWIEFTDVNLLNNHRLHCRIPLEEQQFTRGFKRDFQCSKCNKFYTSRTNLRIHFELKCFATKESRAKYGEGFTCHDCGKTFSQSSGLKYHRDVVHEKIERNFNCPKCGRNLSTQQSLDNHKQRCDPTKPEPERKFQCPICQGFFGARMALQSHISTRHGGVPEFGCRFCPKSFHALAGRAKHETIHHTRAFPLKCAMCMEEFYHLQQLKRHAEIEHRVSKKEDLEAKIIIRIPFAVRQQQLEEALKKFKCQRCDRGFPTSERLKSHQEFSCNKSNSQTGQGRFYCDKCDKWFETKERFTQHLNFNCIDGTEITGY